MLLPLLLNNLLEGEADVHNLTANSVESDSEVSSPGLAQVHALAATSVQSVSQVTSPAIGQLHALTATSVQSASEVSEPDLEALSEHALIATSVQSLSQVSSPALAQVHVLLAASIQALSTVSRPLIGPEPTSEKRGGDDAWFYEGPAPKQKDYRPELDDKRLKERQELRETLERAAGLIEEAEELSETVDSPVLDSQVIALRTEFTALKEEVDSAAELRAAQARVDMLIATAADALVLQIADVLTDLIQEIAEDE